mmetsp:Transcript_42559/g.102596  ORF Transcript_42559/g.102596 Transcript_42559/m.102596 type:complete len:81 (+) Transcript_42559:4855-5097(+)
MERRREVCPSYQRGEAIGHILSMGSPPESVACLLWQSHPFHQQCVAARRGRDVMDSTVPCTPSCIVIVVGNNNKNTIDRV